MTSRGLKTVTQQEDLPDLPLLTGEPSKWCNSGAKRVFDVLVASMVVILTAPLLPLIALAIKLSSPGPVLFVHDRVGQNGKKFRMFKFRSMVQQPSLGVSLTRSGDRRITRVGAFLRRWKLDELPQLINVLRGEMSVVGPRPHMQALLGEGLLQELYLSLRPGVTGPATLYFRDEERLLPSISGRQLEQYYIASILPLKIRMDLQYAQHATLFSDIDLVLQTVRKILTAARRHQVVFPARFSRAAVSATVVVLFLLLGWPFSKGGLGRRFLASAKNVAHKSVNAAEHELLGRPNPVAHSDSKIVVWVDLTTGLYFCPGSNDYGRSSLGKQITEAEAQSENFRSATRAECITLYRPTTETKKASSNPSRSQ